MAGQGGPERPTCGLGPGRAERRGWGAGAGRRRGRAGGAGQALSAALATNPVTIATDTLARVPSR